MNSAFHFQKRWFVFLLPALILALVLVLPRAASAQTLPPTPEQEKRLYEDYKMPRMLPENATETLELSASDGPQSDDATWNRVVFQTFVTDNWDIITTNRSNRNATNLTANQWGGKPDDMQPRLSADASQIVFASNREYKEEGDIYKIHVMNWDGSNVRKLTGNNDDSVLPDWSSDGTKIAYQSYQDGHAEVYVVNTDGSNTTRLTYGDAYNGQPRWSPDGSKIAFVSARTGGYRIWVMNADGSNQQQISTQAYSSDPVWSPDGTKIGFDADVDGDTWQELMVMNADGSNPQMISDTYNGTPTDIRVSAWALNGRYLVYSLYGYSQYNGQWYWTSTRMESWDFEKNTVYASDGTGDSCGMDWKSLDFISPKMQLSSLPAISGSPFTLFWTGSDQGLAGFKVFELQMKNAAHDPWIKLTKSEDQTSYTVNDGYRGTMYYFRVRAVDNAENTSPWYETQTMVEMNPPQARVLALPKFSPNWATIRWSGIDIDSQILSYDIQVKAVPGGTWTNWITATPETSAQFQSDFGQKYCFRARARDKASNLQPWSTATCGDTETTIYNWETAGMVYDNSGTPIQEAQLNINPVDPYLGSVIDLIPGSFNLYAWNIPYTSGAFDVSWQKNGYGNVPTTTLETTKSYQLEIALPPADNVIGDGDFEITDLPASPWQVSGTIPAALSGDFHTGSSSISIGEQEMVWSKPDLIATNTYFWPHFDIPKLFIDSQGNIHALWKNYASADMYYAFKPYERKWSDPVIIQAEAYVAEMDALDNLHLVWCGGVGLNHQIISSTGVWGTAEIIPQKLYVMTMKIDSQGQIYLVGSVDWGSYSPYKYIIRSGGSWSTPLSLAGSARTLTMAIDHNDTVHMLYENHTDSQGYSLVYRSISGGVITPEIVMKPSDGESYPRICVDDNDNVYGAWSDAKSNFYDTYFSKKEPGKPWGKFEKLPVNVIVSNLVYYQDAISLLYSNANGIHMIQKNGDHWGEEVDFLGTNPDHSSNLFFGPNEKIYFTFTDNGNLYYKTTDRTTQTGNVILSQTITLPVTMTNPTLSFFYRLNGASSEYGVGLNIELETATGTQNLATYQKDVYSWIFQSIDLSAWAGEVSTLTFRINQEAGKIYTIAELDDVTVGSTYSDAWVSSPSLAGYPGDVITTIIDCGNQGGAPAADVALTLDWPAGLTFVSADPAPATQTASQVVWLLGDLPARSVCNVQISAQISPDLDAPVSLAQTAAITTASGEPQTYNNAAMWVVDVLDYVLYFPFIKR